MRVLRAIYGCIEAALQWYKMFTDVLSKKGFVLNLYDKYIANKEINGKRCTVLWHDDDVFVTHVSEEVLDDFAKDMIEEFGDMNVEKGPKHSF